MAEQRLPLTREQLAKFLPNHQAVKEFESLFQQVTVVLPDAIGSITADFEAAFATLRALAFLNAADLTANVVGILPLANGGSNNNAIPSIGTIIFSDGTKYIFDAGLTWDAVTGLLSTKNITGRGLIDISAAGAGQIKFPAVQNPSADANMLDDYEKGVWVPTDQSGAALALAVNSATYTKIGRLVFARADITYPVTASGAAASIGGFPFAVANRGAVPINSQSAVAGLVGQLQAGATNMLVKTTASAAVTNAQLSNGFIVFSAVYEV